MPSYVHIRKPHPPHAAAPAVSVRLAMPHDYLQLQRLIGNRALGRLLGGEAGPRLRATNGAEKSARETAPREHSECW